MHNIITDIGLPDGSGTELACTYRAWERACGKQRTPIFAVRDMPGRKKDKTV